MALDELPQVIQLNLASVELPATHPAAGLGRTIPVHGFLIHHPDGVILVDTGVGFGNEFIDGLYKPTCTDLDVALSEHGVALEEIVTVVNSHLHFDHCGQNPALFDGSTAFYSQGVEIEAVTADEHYTARRWALCPTAQQRVVKGDEEITDGVKILATPGHTAGHQSVLIEAGRNASWSSDSSCGTPTRSTRRSRAQRTSTPSPSSSERVSTRSDASRIFTRR